MLNVPTPNVFAPGGQKYFFDTSNLLPTNLVVSLEKDQNGDIWIGSHQGILKLDPKTIKLSQYGPTEGLATNEFTWGSKLGMSDGDLLPREEMTDIIIEAGLKQHDILPLIGIIKKAGGNISNWNGGEDIKNGSIIVSSNLKLHKKFLFLINNF